MADVMSTEQRRRNMQHIKARNTSLEIAVRRGLHQRGLRYRLYDKGLPGRPDLVFRTARVAVFVHGCFWHQHGCSLSTTPTTRPEFWRAKFEKNSERDLKAIEKLHANGWRVLVIRECAIRKAGSQRVDRAIDLAASFIRNDQTKFLEIDSTILQEITSRHIGSSERN